MTEGWVIMNANMDQYRAWQDGGTVWVKDLADATFYARRVDAEAVHLDDDAAWRVVLRPLPDGGEAVHTGQLRDESVSSSGSVRDEAALPEAVATFQERVAPWMLACFGEEIAADRLERNDRFIEEALELCQANGYDATRAHQLVDYVFSRPVGEKWNEVGGVMVTLAALCNTIGVDIDEAADRELARVWTKVEQIREKQKSKPKGSALPIATPAPPPVGGQAGDVETVERFGDAIDAATRIHAWIDAIAAADTGKVPSREIRNYTFNEDDGGAVLYFRNNRVAAGGFMVRDLHNFTVSMKVFAPPAPTDREGGR